MNCRREDLALYAVTDRAWLRGQTLYEQVEQSLRGGVTMLQLREKNLSDSEFMTEALELQKLCRQYHTPFIINDNVRLAKEIDADGVHVGQSDWKPEDVRQLLGEHKIIGVSAKTVEQALIAEKNGADYIGCGAVFATDTKKDASVIAYDTLKSVCEAVSIPVVAIGGITKSSICKLKGSKICGVAVVSAIFAQSDIEQATKELRQEIEQHLMGAMK